MERDESEGAARANDDPGIDFVVNGVEIPFQEAKLGTEAERENEHGFDDQGEFYDDDDDDDDDDDGGGDEEEEDNEVDDEDHDDDDDDEDGDEREEEGMQEVERRKQNREGKGAVRATNTLDEERHTAAVSAESFTPGESVLNILFKVDPSIDECKAEIDNLVAILKRSHEHIQKLESALREAGWSKEAWEGWSSERYFAGRSTALPCSLTLVPLPRYMIHAPSLLRSFALFCSLVLSSALLLCSALRCYALLRSQLVTLTYPSAPHSRAHRPPGTGRAEGS